jgi:hypothetical protein
MKKLSIILLLAALLVPVRSVSAQTGMSYRGINVLYYGGSAQPEAVDQLLDTLQGMQVNAILLTIPVYIDSWDGNAIMALPDENAVHPEADTPTTAELEMFISKATTRHISVLLRPLLDEATISATGPAGAWRGVIQPQDPTAFMQSYQELLTSYATLPGLSWLIIGSELNSLEQPYYDQYWTAIIGALRQARPALKLSYAQNWDTGMYLGYPSWFNQLDATAIDAYFPIKGVGNDGSATDIAASLSAWQSNLQALKDQAPGKPLFITELGLVAERTNPSVLERPWSWADQSATIDLDLQSRYITGTCTYYQQAQDTEGQPLVDALFWWETSVYPPQHPEQDGSFEVIGKPAQQAITTCYS